MHPAVRAIRFIPDIPKKETVLRISLLPRLFFLLLSSLALSAPAARAEGIAGPYLAARQAEYSRDFAASVKYGIRAIARDPKNARLMEGLLIAEIGLGQYDQARPIAQRLHALEAQNQIAGLVLLAGYIHDGRWDDVLRLLDRGISVGTAVDELIRAWAHFGKGEAERAMAIFSAAEEGSDPGQLFPYHRALALAMSGDFASAAAILTGREGPRLQLDRRGVMALAQILSQLERGPEAVELIDASFPGGGDSEIRRMRAELAAGKPLAFDVVTSPAQVLADVFATIAQVLARDTQPQVVLLYSRTGEYLDPHNYDALLLSAALLEMLELHELAAAAYARVPESSRLYLAASLSRAEVLRNADRAEEAIEVLESLARTFPDDPDVQKTLGDTYRLQGRCEDALAPYDRAVELVDKSESQRWVLYFVRGICRAQTDRWDEAEADFLEALEIDPDQPSVLNYLGYSWVEQRRNLERALDMIERAVAARPEDGYITDSLGWVHYRLGNYDAAVRYMERAVELIPVDPVLNDHLGDVYWAVGRRQEARFQWSRALSFITEDTDLGEIDPDRIRRKLEVGLDRVLEEEGAEPIVYANEGG